MAFDGLPNPRDVHSTKGGPGIHPRRVRDVDDTYDLVVVGAGASGLAAAKWYQDRFGANAKILLIDPLPDFGGHSHRNEFHIPAPNGDADVMLLRNGGTVNLDSIGTWNKPAGGLLDIPGSYGQPALDMLAFCGVDPNNFPSTTGPGIPAASTCARSSCSRARTGARTHSSPTSRRADLGGVPRDDAVLGRGAGRASCGRSRTRTPTGSRSSTARRPTRRRRRSSPGSPTSST